MCGLFGVLLPGPSAGCTDRTLDAVLRLGSFAEERGVDAAGLAWQDRSGWHGVRHTLPFTMMAGRLSPARLVGLGEATLVLGHTRWATQGGRSVKQAGPNWVGSTVGTHNGDLDIASLPGSRQMGERTDSQVFFTAVHRITTGPAAGDGAGVDSRLVKLCEQMRGRAAAVWADTGDDTDPGLGAGDGHIWLLRAGLSPLAVGYDRAGGLWYASNPAWLRQLETEQAIGVHRVRMLGEGSLWRAAVLAGRVRLQQRGEFVPTVRARDVRLARTAVWRGFNRLDMDRDRARLRHVVETVPPEQCVEGRNAAVGSGGLAYRDVVGSGDRLKCTA